VGVDLTADATIIAPGNSRIMPYNKRSG